METAAGVGAAGAVGLFGYNRHNFLYDRKLRQETEYQIMDFRIKQAELWRDDVRDIVGLTSVKMDTYLILNTVQLGFCVMAFCEGRLALGTPTWLISCHTLSLAGASMYLFMSIWMAMHASVTAKSYEVRLLTQLVRLPIPTWAQMEGARTYGSSFEKVEAAQMFRVPFLTGSQESVQERIGTGELELASESGQGVASSAGGAPTAATEAQKGKPADLWGLEGRGDQLYELDGKARVDPSQLRHLRLVREALQYWQSYDAFARVSMSLGTNQLVTALSYYVLGYVLIANHAVMASWFTVGLFMAVAAALIRLDMSLTTFEYYMSVALVVAGPLLTAVASHSWVHLTPEEVVARDHPVITALVPIVFAAHSLWFLFLLYVCKVGEQKGGAMLPVGFRSVMYIDIFGWIKQKQKKLRRPTGRFADAAGRGATPFAVDYPRSLASWDEERACEEAAPLASQPPRAVPCAGPAIQSVTHDPNGRPLPLRPEALPGAAEPLESVEVHAEDFVPTTFVPWLREEDEYERYEFGIQPFTRPGLVPWRIFVLTTMLLMILWFIVGVTHVMAFLGDTTFKVHPLTEDDGLEDVVDQNGEEPIAQVAELSGGHPFSTRWPRVGIRPHSLSCAAASGGGNHDVVVVAATHFRLLTARISAEASDMQTSELQASRDRTTRSSHGLRASAIRLQDTSPPAIRFEEAPLCQELEGESIQDIAAYCGPSTNRSFDNKNTSCHAWVLHRQGQRLSMCPLKHDEAQARAFGFHGPQVHAGSLSTAWLQERDETYSLPQEEVSHLAVGGDLCGGTPCAYAQTSSRRIVELANGNNKGGDAFWFPARVLHSGKASKRSGWLCTLCFGPTCTFVSVRFSVVMVVADAPGDTAAPPAPSISMSQVVPLMLSLGLSKVDLQEMGYTTHVEIAYCVVQVLCLSVLAFVYTKVSALSDDGEKIKIPEVKQLGQVVTPATEMTVKEHDNTKLQAQAKQLLIGAVILGGIYYKWRYLFPLVMQLVMTPMQMFESPLFQIHVLGKTVPRPFPEPNPFGLPPTPEVEEEKKNGTPEIEEEKKNGSNTGDAEESNEEKEEDCKPKADEDKKED